MKCSELCDRSRRAMNCSTIFFLVVFVATRVCVSLRVTSVSVPEARARGSSATLACDFELEGARLYSVKWYKDNEEFYRYMPRVRPPQHAYQLDGITVDLDKSSARRVYLRNLTLRSRGLYRCEVSEEAPAFYSAQAEAFMEVYYFPREGPIITGHERRYQEGQPLDINCTSAKVFPAPALQWQINGEKVTEPIWLMSYGVQPDSTGLVVSTLALHAPARLKMKLRCLVTVGMHRREKTVVIDPTDIRYVTTVSLMAKLNHISLVVCASISGSLMHFTLATVLTP